MGNFHRYRHRPKTGGGLGEALNRLDIRTAIKEEEGILPESCNIDDQTLAATALLMRRNPLSAMLLVVSDIIMRKGCEFADIPFVEPRIWSESGLSLCGNRYGDSDLIVNRRVDINLTIRGSYGNDKRVANALIEPLVVGILLPPAANRIYADG